MDLGSSHQVGAPLALRPLPPATGPHTKGLDAALAHCLLLASSSREQRSLHPTIDPGAEGLAAVHTDCVYSLQMSFLTHSLLPPSVGSIPSAPGRRTSEGIVLYTEWDPRWLVASQAGLDLSGHPFSVVLPGTLLAFLHLMGVGVGSLGCPSWVKRFRGSRRDAPFRSQAALARTALT